MKRSPEHARIRNKEIYDDRVYHFRLNNEHPFIIDCGANYGVSVTWFKQFSPNARITAVEADPNIFAILKRNIDRFNYDNVTLLQRAVSHQSGDISFHCSGADSGRLDYLGHADDQHNSVIQVKTIKLDELIGDQHVDFLKIDIEGAELEVIKSSNKLHQVEQMFIEYHSFIQRPQELSELLSILEKGGFRYYIDKIFAPQKPFIEITDNQSMDLQLAISAIRV